MRRDWPLKQIKRLGSWLEELRTCLRTGLREKLNFGQESMASFFQTRVMVVWWYSVAYVVFSGTVVASEEVRNSWTGGSQKPSYHNTFRSGKPGIKGMERCPFCLSRSVLPTGERHPAQSATTDGKNCAGKSQEFCQHFFGGDFC